VTSRAASADFPRTTWLPGSASTRHALRVLTTHPLVARRELRGTAGTRGIGLLFGAVNAGLLGPVEELVAQWRPDLVVHEPLACAAAVAAARHRVPAVLQDNTLVDGVALVAAHRHRPSDAGGGAAARGDNGARSGVASGHGAAEPRGTAAGPAAAARPVCP
jgi:hypothetical protein